MADRVRPGDRLRVAAPVADLRDGPSGQRQRQLLRGDPVTVEAVEGACFWVQSDKDRYRGAVDPLDLGPAVAPTHQVGVLATHLYTAADIKAPEAASLSFGARLAIEEAGDTFGRTHDGLFVPMVHLVDARRRFRDPAGVAELFPGTPYLWGGNSRLGLDCSGLVQAACLACGLSCPGDSGQQEVAAGEPVAEDAPLERGDLVFWRGHVAMAVSDTILIHANAHHMAVAFEEAEMAVRRIAGQGGGPVTGRRRLSVT